MWPILLLVVPLLAAFVALVVGWRAWTPWINFSADLVVLVVGVGLAVRDIHHGPLTAVSGVLRVDSLSAYMVIVIGAITTLAAWGSVRYLRHEVDSQSCTVQHAIHYSMLFQCFVSAMLLAVLAANIGILWVAIEATTIATTFLVGHRRTRGALEASWKYIILCSVGIALAFLGTVLVYLAAVAVHAGGHSLTALDWTWLSRHAHAFNPAVMRLAIGLLVLGYGAKVGLVPMHSWLPDAHSQAPAPVSAMMSGVLLSVAFYALIRFKAIAVACVGETYPRYLFAALAVLSLVLASLLLLTQRDLKRALAYSSTEHMGLMALGAAAGGPLAMAGVLLHILGHGLAKGSLFLTSGEIAIVDGTSTMDRAAGLLERRPALGGALGAGLAALLGFPPFSLFVSEIIMMRGEMSDHLTWAVVVSLAALTIAFAAFINHGRLLLFGGRSTHASPMKTSLLVMAPIVIGLAGCALLGIFVWPLSEVLHAAARLASS